MSIHLDGLNPDMRDDRIEFPADVNGKRICCVIDRTVLERLSADNWRPRPDLSL